MSDQVGHPLENGPQYAVTYSSFDEEEVCIAIKCRLQLFFIDVVIDDLQGWSERSQFLQLARDADDNYEAEESLYDAIMALFLPFMDTLQLPTIPTSTSISLQDFFRRDVLPFKLVYDGKDARFVETQISARLMRDLVPKIKLCDIPNAMEVLHIDASKTQILPYFTHSSDLTSDSPVKIALPGSTSVYYFKAVRDRRSFVREFKILFQLSEQRLTEKLRLPVLHSLVTYSNTPTSAMGFLLHYINHDGSMAHWLNAREPSQQLREKWCSQITDMTQALHQSGIVWGDVKPENVLIDDEQNAWIIDFGGGFCPDFVDEAVMETVDGDAQGVKKIRQILLEG